MAVAPSTPRIGRRPLTLIGLGVGLPALFLVGVAIFLTLRISHALEEESARYNSYIALQVGETFERELLAELRTSIPPAESAAHADADTPAVMAALRAGTRRFLAPHFVPEDEITGMTAIIVESTALLYAPGEGAHRGGMFAGLLLHRSDGQVLGVGGWWFDPRRFLLDHFEEVVQDRLPENPRLYGGIVSTRRLSVALIGPSGEELGRIRQPGDTRTARIEGLTGPFEGFGIRVAPALGAPAAWATHFRGFMTTFIALMALVILVATLFGLNYLSRQLELAHLKSSFISNVTHELKTPIALIRLSAETLEMHRVRNAEEGDAFLRGIIRETVRLQQLVDNILDFARLEAGQVAFRFEDVDLLYLVRETIDTFRPRLEHLGFRIELDLPDSLPTVRGDPRMLQHCMLNLLDNALKYSRTRREVRVSAEAREDAATVAVTDHGIGIAPADQKRIFEKFVRVETGLVHDVKGAGLGLALVQQIMRAHGGRVEVTSTLGEGSTFTLVFPRTGASSEEREIGGAAAEIRSADRRTGT
ncbi:MAG TPA: HAMP domain-containing sensor histidine kinase [Terriglobales bacterium]|nr:HAMP domain-containing sensor histidine kinase [Terriglobales bacterium]